jgi:hypothetical protein
MAERLLGLDLAKTTLPDAIAAMVEAWYDAQDVDVNQPAAAVNIQPIPQLPAHAINCTKGAEMISAETGRSCSRQNLEKLCNTGALRGSPCILQPKPLRLDPDLLVSEYTARIGQPRGGAAGAGPPLTNSPTLSVAEAAAATGFSRQAVHRAIKDGRLSRFVIRDAAGLCRLLPEAIGQIRSGLLRRGPGRLAA